MSYIFWLKYEHIFSGKNAKQMHVLWMMM